MMKKKNLLVPTLAVTLALGGSLSGCFATPEEAEITSITVEGNYKTEYTVGESFDTTGLIVKATLADGTEKTLSLENVSFDKSVLSLEDTAVTVSYSVNEVSLTYVITITVNPVVHHFGEWQITTKPTLNDTGVAKRVCTDNDGEEQIIDELPCLSDTSVWTLDASKGTAPTHLATGTAVYVSEYGEVSVELPADSEHSYNVESVAWTWDKTADGYDVSAKFTCSVVGCGGVTASYTATIVKNTTASTCDVKGSTVYTATVEFNGTTYTDQKTDELDLIAHSYGEIIPEVPAACGLEGVKAHYVCGSCGKIFIEESGEKVEVQESDLVISALTHSYTEISVDAQSAKTVYVKGESLDTTGLVVKQYCEHCKQWSETTDYTVGEVDLTTVGTKTVTVTVGENTATFDVNVYEQVIDLTANGYYYDFDLSQSGSYTLDTQGLNGQIVSINGLTEGFAVGENNITIQKSLLTALLNGKAYGDVQLTIVTDTDYVYEIVTLAVTKIIKTADDLASIHADNVLDGYYILANDIDMINSGAIRLVDYSGYTNNEAGSAFGFKGIFDGRGYTISNLTTKNGGYAKLGGLFGQVLKGAVIKNVVFDNISTDQSNNYNSLLTGESCRFMGTLENVVIIAKGNVKCVVWMDRDWFACKDPDDATFKNVIVTGVEKFEGNGLYRDYVINNLIVVGSGSSDKYTMYNSVTSLLNSLKEDNVLVDCGSITYENNAIYYNGVRVVTYPMTAECVVKETTPNSTVEFTVVDATLALKEQIAGVSLEGNVLTIGVVENGTAITVVATSIYDETLTKEFEITVIRNYENVDLTANKLYYEVAGAENEIALEGEVEAVRLVGGDRITEGYTYSDGKLALSQALISSLLGGKAYSESLNIEVVTSSDKIYKLDIAVVTKLIKTMDDFVALRTTGNTLNGYFVLINDIVYEGTEEMPTLIDAWGATKTTGFVGIFDGLGHSIINLKVHSKSVFNTVGVATIRNIAFINLQGAETGSALVRESHGATYENIFVSSNTKFMMDNPYDSPTFKNVMFVSTRSDAEMFHNGGTGTLSISNAVVVGAKVFNYFNAGISKNGDKVYSSINDMFSALEEENFLADFGSITYEDSAIYFNGTRVVVPTMSVSCEVKETSVNSTVEISTVAATLSLKEQIAGVSIEGNVLTIGVVDNNTIITVVATSVYDESITEEIQIKVVRAYSNVDLTANKLYYEVAGAENEIALEGEIEAVRLVGGDRITEGYTYSDGKLALSQALVSSLLNGKAYTESLNIEVITSADKIYKLNIAVATKIISSAEDLTAITQANTASVIDAYYILANDIDASTAGVSVTSPAGATYNNVVRFVNNDTQSSDTVGFKGIFDGQGHVISNITTYAYAYNGLGGLFGQLLAGSQIKNVAFTNVNLTGRYAIVLVGESKKLYGTIENVAITVAGLDMSAGGHTTAFILQNLAGGEIKNCLFVNVGTISNGASATKVSNVMSVATTRKIEDKQGGFHWTGVANYMSQPCYHTVDAMLEALATDNKLQNWGDITYNAEENAIYYGETIIVEAQN